MSAEQQRAQPWRGKGGIGARLTPRGRRYHAVAQGYSGGRTYGPEPTYVRVVASNEWRTYTITADDEERTVLGTVSGARFMDETRKPRIRRYWDAARGGAIRGGPWARMGDAVDALIDYIEARREREAGEE